MKRDRQVSERLVSEFTQRLEDVVRDQVGQRAYFERIGGARTAVMALSVAGAFKPEVADAIAEWVRDGGMRALTINGENIVPPESV